MKKTAALLLASLVSGASLNAQESSYSVTMDFAYVSDYVFRGIKYADDAIQPSIEFATGDFYAGIWISEPVTNTALNEYDFYAGYGIAISETWALDLGATYYYYPETSSGDEQFEPFIGASGDLGGGLSGSAYYFYETEFEVSTFQFGIGYSTEMSDKSTFDVAADYGFVSTDGPGDYNYFSLSGTFNYALNDSAGSYLGLVFTDNDISGADGSYFYFITGLSIGF
jgi:uncharacterized protein (TIGR02001 family)